MRRRHRRQQAQEDCDRAVKDWYLHEVHTRDVAKLAQGQRS